ncbi:hypothetical protein OE88DRAFT_1209144 [Heliocybe sulcata]|uniref:Uncharacterized protein n=1 Tax=Heliocybe sulcata TaxID=5364 RepID=A0A5C3NCI4_9AGAM|nr:hypothetical protein OE88DRAFT_1209144 [Heliocybe sulcata]
MSMVRVHVTCQHALCFARFPMLPSVLFLTLLSFAAASPDVLRVPLTKRVPKLSRRANPLDTYAAAASHLRAKYGFVNSTAARRKRANSAEEQIIDQVRSTRL